MTTILIALLVFGTLILVHEGGHYVTARLFGVKINEFAIGMGPRLLSRKSKKTGIAYSLCAFPIGGYVAMAGEDEESDDENALNRKPVWQRMIITAAGATLNLLLGLILMTSMVLSAKTLTTTTVFRFSEEVSVSNKDGLQVGDRIVKVNGASVNVYYDLAYHGMRKGTEPVDLTVIRDGNKIVLEDVVFPQFEDQDIIFGESDFKVWAIRDPSLWQLIRVTCHRSLSLVKMVWDSLFNLITGRFSVSSLSSPIGVTAAVKDTITQSGWDAQQILQYVLNITAVISINLGVFNLIPFPALDGGRFLFLVIEGIRRKPISQEIESKIHFAGIVLLMILMVLVVSKDIIALIF